MSRSLKISQSLVKTSGARLQLVALQALFDLSDDAFAIITHDQAIFDINPAFCRMLGYSREQLIDRLISDLFANEGDWRRLSVEQTVGLAQSPWQSSTVLHHSGHTFPVVARVFSNTAVERGDEFSICLIREVARASDAASSPVNSQEYHHDRLLRLTAGLAHDFNNILAVISGNVQLAHMKSDRLSAEPFLRQAELGCAMAARMIDQLFTISRTRRLDPDVISIADFLQNRLALFQGSVGSGVRIRLEFSHQLETIRADMVGLENALLNLVLNARQAMPDVGTIDIRASQTIFEVAKELAGGHITTGTYLRISVKDNGCGMPQHIRQRAFEPYITTKLPHHRDFWDSAAVPSSTGCGLGLAQVHGFITQSGGGVDLESAIGQGTTVSLYLPMN